METYHKIQTVYLRDPDTNFKTLLEGQYSLREFEYLKNNVWVFTEKVDGTNIRIIFNNGELEIKGKTDNANIPPRLFDKLTNIFTPKIGIFMSLFNDESVCLYGEGFGSNIQHGFLYGKEPDFVLFDIKIGHWWLKREDVENIAEKLDLKVVPIIGTGTLDEMVELVRNGFKSKWGNFISEGVVARPEVELKDRSGSRIITKLKYRDFTLNKLF
jgi:ATP-dependent RNA circularization protein (DNA/RNA ligase family)